MASQGKGSLVINIRNNIENIKKDKDLALETIFKIQIRDCIDKWCADRLWKLVFKFMKRSLCTKNCSIICPSNGKIRIFNAGKMGHNGPDFWGPKFEEDLNIYRQITWSYTRRLLFHYIWG